MAQAQSLSRNRLLAALPVEDQQRLLPKVEVLSLPLRQILHQPGELISHAYFPGGGFLSLLQSLQDGTMVEVATIGREGVAGIEVMTAPDGRALTATMVQGETDTCYRIATADLAAELKRGGALAALVSRYARAATAMAMQSTACNAVHLVEHRFARWLLMAHDRMESHTFLLTQEFAAMMLGASRPTVTLVAGVLQRSGLIDYHRGKITILDRPRLESASCECYAVVTNIIASVFERDAPSGLGEHRQARS